MKPKPFIIPKPALRLMREFVKGVVAGAQYTSKDYIEVIEDGWLTYGKYDINIYRNKAGNITAAVHATKKTPSGTLYTDGDRFIKLNIK